MKKIVSFTVLISFFLGLSLSVNTIQAKADGGFNASAKAAIAVDNESGKILYTKNEDEKLEIASITKLITAYMTYQAIEEGKIKWDDAVTISDYAYNISLNNLLTGGPYEQGKTYTVKELLEVALVASDNSAAIALAEKIGGSEPQFIDLAKKKLEEWGVNSPHLVNASGLNNEYLGSNIYPNSAENDENKLSAKDVAIIAQRLITDYPEVLEITKQTIIQWEGYEVQTWNMMLPEMPMYRKGVDGLKTGTTELAGQCFVGTTIENGVRIITVVLNAENADSDAYARFTVTDELMDYVYSSWKKKVIIKRGDVFPSKKTIDVIDGKKATVKLVSDSDLSFWVHEAWTDLGYKETYNAKHKDDAINAPVSAGKTQAGTMSIHLNADKLGYLNSSTEGKQSVILVAKNNVKRDNVIKLKIKHFINWVNEKL